MAEEQPRTRTQETRWFWRLPQGATEFVPIGSSPGQTVIIPGLLDCPGAKPGVREATQGQVKQNNKGV